MPQSFLKGSYYQARLTGFKLPMKRILLLQFVFSLNYVVFSQQVIGTQGETQMGANGSLEYTIGEVVINTISNGSNDLTQGFHQTRWDITPFNDPTPDFEVIIYPNPVTDQLNIQTNLYKDVTYSLYDESGKVIIESILESELTSVPVDYLSGGVYFLALRNDKLKLSIKTFKIIKSL